MSPRGRASISRRIVLAVAGVLLADLLLVLAATVLQTESLSRALYGKELLQNASYPAQMASKAESMPDPAVEMARFVADYEASNPYRIGYVPEGKSPDLPWIDGARIEAVRRQGGAGIVRVGDIRYYVLVASSEKLSGIHMATAPLDLVIGKRIPLVNDQAQPVLLYASLTMLLVGLPTVLVLYFVLRRMTDPVVAMSRVAERIADGDFSESVATAARDEIGDLGRSIDHMTRRLKEMEEAREERWAILSHELRTPLAILKANAKGILDGVVPPEEAARYLQASLGEIDRLTLLVEGLVLASSMERGAPAQPTDGDLGVAAVQAVDAMRRIAEDRGVSFALDVARPLYARFDAAQVRQVLLNLLDNAVRHSPPGGRVHVSAQPRDGRVSLVVRDEGPGLGDGDPERWFEAGRKESGSPGLGLGLTLARRIVEAHGGTLRGRTADASGAEFEILLPGP